MAGDQHKSKLDPSRYFAVGVVGFHFVMALLALNFAAVFVAGPAPSWLIPKQQWLAHTMRDDLGQRLAGIVQERRAAGVVENPRVVILGFSTVREGFDPSVFEPENRGLPRCWNLGTSGSGFQQLNEQVELFCASGVTADVVLLGIHPSYLVGRRSTYQPTDLGDIWEAVRRLRPRQLKHALGRFFWLSGQRPLIHRWIERRLAQARMLVLKNVDIHAVFKPATEPFAVRHEGYPLHQGHEFLSNQMKHWDSFGWFDPAQYEENLEQQKYLVDAVRQLRARSRLVGVVLMPERSALRRRVPPIANRTLRALLDEYFADAPVALIDLRDEFDDGMFSDYAHLNSLGREAFSVRLARELDTVIK